MTRQQPDVDMPAQAVSLERSSSVSMSIIRVLRSRSNMRTDLRNVRKRSCLQKQERKMAV